MSRTRFRARGILHTLLARRPANLQVVPDGKDSKPAAKDAGTRKDSKERRTSLMNEQLFEMREYQDKVRGVAEAELALCSFLVNL